MNTKMKMIMRSIGFAILGLFLSSVLWAETITGKVVAVVDGNTLEVSTNENETYKILLFGIDSPELNQEYGEEAKQFLEDLILHKNVDIEIQGKDRVGNRLGIFTIAGHDPREKLLEAGLAWTAERNPPTELEIIKEKSREKGKGLWKEKDPTPPWIFRRQQSMAQPKTS